MKPSHPSDRDPTQHPPTAFEQQVMAKARRKAQARREGDGSMWSGLGVFGLVGWSVILPTLVGIALGRWIDHRRPSPYSWTLMLLFVGLVLGCWSAWHWIQQEQGR